jgi:hypothetical protein
MSSTRESFQEGHRAAIANQVTGTIRRSANIEDIIHKVAVGKHNDQNWAHYCPYKANALMVEPATESEFVDLM